MENNNNVKKVSSQVMELKDLISGPLIATIDADSISSQRYLSYLMEVAFESYNKGTGEVGKLRTLTFCYTSHDINGSHEQRVSIPLMTLVPLPLLQVKEADFDFDIQIVDAVTEERQESFSLKEGAVQKENEDEGRQGMKLRVSLAPSQGSGESKSSLKQGLTANMKVRVKMQQADIPGGLANLLHLTANNMQIEDVESEEIPPIISNNENGDNTVGTEDDKKESVQ
jgi:Protein of unknown function (DUF2589).